VTIHIVDLVQYTHTCPADLQPHVVEIRRTIVDVIDGGPCRKPVTVTLAGTTQTVACGRRELSADQCPACRTVVVQRRITTIDRGHQGPTIGTTGGVAA
jgi:hypothetical protein